MDYGVRLALEPMVGTGADQWTVFASPEDTLAFVGDYHPQALGLVMDMSMWPAERATGAAIAGLLPRLALVQLSDRSRESKCGFDRCLLGHGHTPCATWIRRLLDAGYNGMFEVELVGRSLEPYSYEHILAHVADVCGRWFKGEGAGTIPRRVAERLTAAPLPAIHPEP
jgi:sugar phosphate isomerase/epimerase